VVLRCRWRVDPLWNRAGWRFVGRRRCASGRSGRRVWGVLAALSGLFVWLWCSVGLRRGSRVRWSARRGSCGAGSAGGRLGLAPVWL